MAFAVLGDGLVADDHLAVEVRLDERLLVDLRRATDVERAHRQLRAGLTDRLGGNDADRFTVVDRGATGQIAAVALAADAVDQLAGQGRTDLHFLDAGLLDGVDMRLFHQRAALDHDLVGHGIAQILAVGTAEDTRRQRRNHRAGIDDGAHLDAELGAAIVLRDDAVLRHVDQTAGQVARVRGLQRGVREALAGAVGRVEVFEHRQTFLEVGNDRRFDDLTRRLGHQAAHAGELAHLRRRTARTGMRHHVDRVDVGVGALRRLLGRGDFLHHLLGDFFRRLRPGVDHLVVLLAMGDQAVVVLLLEVLRQRTGGVDDLPLGVRNDHVVLAERNAGLERVVEAERHDAVAEDHRLLLTAVTVDLVDDAGNFALGHQLVDDVVRNLRRARQQVAEHDAAGGGLDPATRDLAGLVHSVPAIPDLGVEVDDLRMQGMLKFGHLAEDLALAGQAFAHDGDVIETEHDVLRRHDDRLAVRGMQDVVGRHHQDARFQLRFQRQRNVHGHLVAVEVGVERGADQRMKLDRLAFNEHRLERLNAETMQRRRAVQQHGMLADDLVENVPDLGTLFFDELLRLLHRGRQTLGVEPRIDERLEQFERHLLRQAALMQPQFGTDHDHRTAGIVDALAEQVLPEAALLALEHVGQRLQRTLVGAGDDATAAAVVEQGVDGLLQHALFVADDDVGGAQLHQPLQAVVAVDDAAVEVVEVGGRKAAAVQRHQRTQVRRNHRHHRQDHPLRLVAGIAEGLDDLQALGELLVLDVELGLLHLDAQRRLELFEFQSLQQLADRLGADHGGEAVLAVFVLRLQILVFRQQLTVLERGQAGLQHDVIFKIQDPLEILQRHVEQETDARRQRLQEPDVRNGSGQFDMTHALATDARQRHFDRALFADDALVLHPLVLAAQALVVLDRPEDAGAEQAVALRLEGAVVDGLRLLDLAVGPGQNLFRGRNRDPDLVEDLSRRRRIEEIHNFLVHRLLLACRSSPAANSKFLLARAFLNVRAKRECPAQLRETAFGPDMKSSSVTRQPLTSGSGRPWNCADRR